MLLAQDKAYIDSLSQAVRTMESDTVKVLVLGELCWLNRLRDADLSIQYGREGIALASELNYTDGLANLWNKLGVVYRHMENFPEALKAYDNALKAAQQANNRVEMAHAYNNMGHAYSWEGKYGMQLDYATRALEIFEALGDKKGMGFALTGAIIACIELRDYEKALAFAGRSYRLRSEMGQNVETMVALMYLGKVHARMGNFKQAKSYLKQAIGMYETHGFENSTFGYQTLAETYLKEGKLDSALYIAKRGLEHSSSQQVYRDMMHDSRVVADIYAARKDFYNAFKYFSLSSAFRDSVQRQDNARTIANHALRQKQQELDLLEKDRQLQEEELAHQKERTRWSMFFFGTILLLVAAVAMVINSNRKKLKAAYLELQAANEEIQTQKEAIEQQAADLQQSNSSKDKLFAIIGHDLRSPVASLRNFLDLVDDKSITLEDLNQLSPHLSRGVVNLSETLENLLQWSQAQLNGIKTTQRPFPVGRVVQSNIDLFSDVAKAKRVTLESQIGPHTVLADEDQIKLVLRNLINNAIKFTRPGGWVRVSSRLVAGTNLLAIDVQDNGVGISPEKVHKLFTLDTRFTNYGTEGEKGTGIGLMLCKEMVQNNGGEITVKSVESEGSVFTFTLPLVN